MKKIIKIICALVIMYSFSSCTNNEPKNEPKFVADLTISNYKNYLGETSFYTENISGDKFYLLISVEIYNLNDAYIFKNAELKCNNKNYAIPQDGNLKITYATKTIPSDDTYLQHLQIMRANYEQIDSITGKIYK